MIRVLNFFCFTLSALACLALYHVSEETRVARSELAHVHAKIAADRVQMSVLEAEWGRVADSNRIQMLAESRLGVADGPTVELSSLELLPRRGEDAPLNNEPLRNASATVPAQPVDPDIQLAAAHSGN